MMNIKDLYGFFLKEERDFYLYYKNEGQQVPDVNILDVDSCYSFIQEYIQSSKKERTLLYSGIEYLKEKDKDRLRHIVSTFLLGLIFFKNCKDCHKAVIDELKRFGIFESKEDREIERHFVFMWFMISIFHDLGYRYEKEGKDLEEYRLSKNKGAVPSLYNHLYRKYYINYRNSKDHGVSAGVLFDESIPLIRRERYSEDPNEWDDKLDEVYHYVAWIIACHNIWFIRTEDGEKIQEYRQKGLSKLILSTEKENGHYKEYPISFQKYPLFTLFCLVDTIEPIKSTSAFSEIDIQIENEKIIISSNDTNYMRRVKGLNDWLLIVENKDNMKVEFSLKCN